MTTHTPAPTPKGSLLTTGQILSLERRSNMTDDEALRFGRAIESALLSKLRAPVADAVPVKASNIDTRDVDVEVHAFGSIFYDHGPNLAEALGRLAQRVARWRNLPAPSLASAPVAGNNMRNPNLSRQGGWIKTDGFCDFLILAGIIGAIVGGILIPEVISFLWDFAKPWIHEVTK